MLEVLFWLLAGLLAYVYCGYPLLLWAIRALRGARPVALAPIEPSVTLLVSAYNEEGSIAEKLHNSLELDYPPEKLEILVVSDASTDRTDAIVSGFPADRVRLLRMSDRGGKTVGLNCAVRNTRSELLVFSDANALYDRESIRLLARNFADRTIGAVVGESTYIDADGQAERSEGLYWKYESAIKRLESDLGSVVGGDGAIYAIRHDLYQEMRADALSDFVNPLQIVRAGRRCVYEPAARSRERAADSFAKEFRRKVRIVNRAWRAMMSMPELLNPLRLGFFSIQLVSHKLLRWLVPLLLLLLLVANLMLVGNAAVYRATLAIQIAFYALAAVGYFLRARASMPGIVAVPYYFCLVNIASALGIVDALCGRTYTTWTTARGRVSENSGGRASR